MRRYLVAILGVAALLLALASPAAAQGEWDVPVDTIVRSKAGVVTELVMIDVPEEHVGASCDLDVIGQNQGSVHPGNDLLVESGESEVVVEGVEDTAFQTTPESVEIMLGQTITVSLVMGQDEVFSGGLTLSFDCPAPATTTTTSTTSTTQPPVATTRVLTSEVTVAPTTVATVAAPTTAPKAVVLGQSQAAQPQAQVLASTGSRSWELALFAMVLVGIGIALKRWAGSAR